MIPRRYRSSQVGVGGHPEMWDLGHMVGETQVLRSIVPVEGSREVGKMLLS